MKSGVWEIKAKKKIDDRHILHELTLLLNRNDVCWVNSFLFWNSLNIITIINEAFKNTSTFYIIVVYFSPSFAFKRNVICLIVMRLNMHKHLLNFTCYWNLFFIIIQKVHQKYVVSSLHLFKIDIKIMLTDRHLFLV